MTVLRDVRYVGRSLGRHRAFALTAVITLALGIGASTAIFSVVNAVLLRPLPYAAADKLVLIWIDLRARGVTDYPFAPPVVKDLREQSTSFSDIAGLFPYRTALTVDNARAEQVRVLGTTSNLLSMLGARVAIGRDFADVDAVAPPAPPASPQPVQPVQPAPPPLPLAVILTHAYWNRRFGGDTNVIGKSVDLGGGPATIVGVLADRFEILFPPNTNVEPNPDMIVAQRIDFVNAPRFNTFLRVVARLKPGVSLATARADVERVAAGQRNDYIIAKTADAHYRVEPMHDDLVADVRPAILALMGAVTFVLLIACANVANLLLVRAAARQRELSIRAALGGSRSRIVRQLLAEAGVLAGVGALVGVALGYVGIKLLIAAAPANVPRLNDVRIDPLVLGYVVLIATLAATVFGAFPAIRASRPNLAESLRVAGRSANVGGRFLRRAVVSVEVALSFVLLVGCGLMVRSFVALAGTDPGFDPKGVLTFSVLYRPTATPDQLRAFVDQLHSRLAAVPGVVAVTAASPLPLDGQISNARWGPAEAANDPSKFQQANVHVVLPGYFEAMRARVIAGRTFTEEDNRPERAGVIIDDVLAAKAFRGQPPIGQKLYARIRGQQPEWLEVIGVVGHERHESLVTVGREAMFFPDRFIGPGTVGRWAVRIDCTSHRKCDPAALAPAARAAVSAIDPLVAVAEMQPMTDYVDRAMSGTRFSLGLITVFAGIAAVLASVGIYGVLSTAVRERTAEIGVRMAYGATRRSIIGLVVRDGMRSSVVGLVAGLAGSVALTPVMRSMLVRVRPTDPRTYAIAVILFVAITVIACWIPARYAASLDPASALRSE